MVLFASAIFLAACSSPSAGHARAAAPATGSGSSTSGSAAVVIIKNFAFDPATLRVAPGVTVTVHNEDGVTHTLSSVSGAFNSGDIGPGATAHFTAPTKAGRYPYRCDIHQFMTGALVVT